MTTVSHSGTAKKDLFVSCIGFIFWSIFQGLASMIWFYPLNELELSGYELFAVVWLSPIVCVIPGVLTFIQNKWVSYKIMVFEIYLEFCF